MSIFRLRAAVGLLTGHITLGAHMYKLGHTEGNNADCVGMIKKCTHDQYYHPSI
jgi:hypothetical protein